MTKHRKPAYTKEFRKDAVLRSQKPGQTTASVAQELGVSPQKIYNWRRQFNRLSDKQFNRINGVDYSKKESEEVRKLKRELATVRKENEFLKKVSAYFANQQE
jgi:transposase